MSLVLASLIVVTTAAIAIAAMLLVRRTAPDGSYFHDGDRAAGVFGVLATGFAVLLGFVVFLAFTSYDAARVGAEVEALTVAQQVETGQFFTPAVATELTGELVCYARSVAGVQWERMESRSLGEQVNPWAVELFRTVRTVEPGTPTEQSAYDRCMDQTSDREAARNDRIHGAVGVIPGPLWVVLFFSAGLILVFVLFFADSGERAVVQALPSAPSWRRSRRCCCCSTSSTIRFTRAWGVFVPWPWSGRWRSLTKICRSPARTRRRRAMPPGTRSRRIVWTG